jgi:hypothetical protein
MVVYIITGRAHAQSSGSSATAEQLFNEARELAKADKWAEACLKFEASLRYDPVLGTRLNLAACYEHIGKLASAWGLYRESMDLAKRLGDVKRHDFAQKQASALEPRLAKLTITAPAKPPAGFVVTRDGAMIDAGALGSALYVDAGMHEITASAPGFEAFTQNITLVESKTETLAIPGLKAAPVQRPDLSKPLTGKHVATTEPVVVPPPNDGHTATNDPAVARSSTRKYIAIGTGAVGAVTISIGFLFGVKANSTFGAAKELCANLVCAPLDYNKGKQLINDTRSNATISTLSVAAGSAAIVASIVMILTTPSTREHVITRVSLVTSSHGVGLAIIGGF